jgi:hypothetical protein
LASSVLSTFLLAAASCGPKASGPGDDGGTTPPQACTEIGCQDGLLIRVTPTEAWPHGAYTFTVEADAKTTTCTGSLPLPACGTPGLTCDGPGVTIGESGCALDPAQHAFADIMFEATPTSVTVGVDLDGRTIASQTFTPEYQTVQPNGPGCDPICTNASVELPLTFDE